MRLAQGAPFIGRVDVRRPAWGVGEIVSASVPVNERGDGRAQRTE